MAGGIVPVHDPVNGGDGQEGTGKRDQVRFFFLDVRCLLIIGKGDLVFVHALVEVSDIGISNGQVVEIFVQVQLTQGDQGILERLFRVIHAGCIPPPGCCNC